MRIFALDPEKLMRNYAPISTSLTRQRRPAAPASPAVELPRLPGRGRREMERIYQEGDVEIWAVEEAHGTDYYVYGVMVNGDPTVCPSLDMAREVAASAL